MKRKLMRLFCIFVISSAAANAQAPPKTPPPPASPGMVRNAEPSPEVQRLGAQIAAYATAQCGGADAEAAPDCRAKALWVAAQCPEKMAATPSEMKTGSRNCAPQQPSFEYEVSSIKLHKNDGSQSSSFGHTTDGYRAQNEMMINIITNAYWTGLQFNVAGGPAWLQDLRFDIEAKFAPEVGEALMKLSRDDRWFVQRYMMQKLLKERMNLAAHVETKAVPASI
jgi:hypothetical protein